jgi:hypothetical protein
MSARTEAFRQGLRELGYIETIVMEYDTQRETLIASQRLRLNWCISS